MACMTHECITCGHVWCNNIPRGRCPMCCSYSVRHIFDEMPSDDVPDTEPFEEDDR